MLHISRKDVSVNRWRAHYDSDHVLFMDGRVNWYVGGIGEIILYLQKAQIESICACFSDDFHYIWP